MGIFTLGALQETPDIHNDLIYKVDVYSYSGHNN